MVTILVGANDLAGQDANVYASKVFGYTDELRAQGAKVAIGTTLPINLSHKVIHNQTRAIYNQILRDNVGVRIDAVIDYDSDPLIGSDAAAANPFYYPDGLHPSGGPGSGQDRMFQIYKPVVDRLLGK